MLTKIQVGWVYVRPTEDGLGLDTLRVRLYSASGWKMWPDHNSGWAWGGGGGARATRLNLEPDLFLFFKCSNLKAFRVSFRKEYLLSDSTWYQKMLAYSV